MDPPSPNLGGGMTDTALASQTAPAHAPPRATVTKMTTMTRGGGVAVDSHGGRRHGSSGPHPGEEGVDGGGARQRPR